MVGEKPILHNAWQETVGCLCIGLVCFTEMVRVNYKFSNCFKEYLFLFPMACKLYKLIKNTRIMMENKVGHFCGSQCTWTQTGIITPCDGLARAAGLNVSVLRILNMTSCLYCHSNLLFFSKLFHNYLLTSNTTLHFITLS